MTDAPTSERPTTQVTLDIDGMTCASSAARITKRLNKLDGVEASVNFATEQATVTVPEDLPVHELVAQVEAIGYGATDHAAASAPGAHDQGGGDGGHEHHHPDVDGLRDRLIVAAVLGIPVLALSMVNTFQFEHWQWLALTLASPVVLWAGWPFHRVAWANLRHGAASMDTLISVGILAAYGWSVYALFWGRRVSPA